MTKSERLAMEKVVYETFDRLDPTGANTGFYKELFSKMNEKVVLSIQMELLKEIASDRLVIMVTHNPDLANQYSTRIIKLHDGLVIDDSMPVNEQEIIEENKIYEVEKIDKNKTKKASMSFLTSIALSFKNLWSNS